MEHNCTNTMHKVAEVVQSALSNPLMQIGQATADALLSRGIKRVGLLGTKYTMQQDFLKKGIQERGIEVLVPDAVDMELINSVIFDELCIGKLLPESKAKFLAVVEKLRSQGAEGVILGCTEIGLLIGQSDTDLPVFDTTAIHAMAAVDFALAH